MGAMMAPKPGATFKSTPATGGKGAAPVVKPGVTTTPIQPQTPYKPIGSQGGKAQPTNTLPAPGQAATVPPQGGKAQNPDGTYTGSLGIPPQGKAQSTNTLPAPGPVPSQLGGLGLANALYGVGQPPTTTIQQPQVPAQGGKGGGQTATPEQLAELQAQLDATRPIPQVQQPAPSNVPSYVQPLVQQLVKPAPVKPAPVKPAPVITPAPITPAPTGLAGLSQIKRPVGRR